MGGYDFLAGEKVPNFPLFLDNCFVDEETLEPFYEQKMDCKRLIEYLSSLQSRMTVAEISAPANKASEKLSKHVADESDG